MIHIWRSWKLSNFQDPPSPLSIYVQIFFTPLTLDVQFQMKHHSPNDNQSIKKNIIQEWLLYVIRPFFQTGFRFQYQLINLVWLSFDFFHLAEASLLYLLLRGFIFLRVQLSENIKKCLLFIVIPIFSTHFAINLSFCTTWKSKQTTEQLRYRAYKRTKSKQKQNQVTSHSNWPHVSLNYDSALWRHNQKENVLSITY